MIFVDSLIIETTRRCNFRCDHCCRGEAQDVDITHDILGRALTQCDRINTLTITGGEPTLNVKAIRDIAGICKSNMVDVERFYIAVNGSQAPNEFIAAITDLYLVTNERDDLEAGNILDISMTEYHKDQGQDSKAIDKLKIFRFTGEKMADVKYNYRGYDRLKHSGRAKDLYLSNDGNMPSLYLYQFNEFGWISIEGDLYITAKGDIVPGCDWSYETMEKIKLGNVLSDDYENVVWTEEEYNNKKNIIMEELINDY